MRNVNQQLQHLFPKDVSLLGNSVKPKDHFLKQNREFHKLLNVYNPGFIGSLGNNVVGGWKELGRTTLGVAGDTITVSGLSDKRYYMVLSHALATGGNLNGRYVINSDTGTNYATRLQNDGASDTTGTSQSDGLFASPAYGNPFFSVGYFSNLSTSEKLALTHTTWRGTAGNNAPNRSENVIKWANTTNAISSIQVKNGSTGDFDIGSEVVVLGWDPADVHTDNFWQQLASVTLGSPASSIDTSTITAKKYLWIQIFNGGLSSSGVTGIRFNSDSATNYAERRSGNGGADATGTSRTVLNLVDTGSTTPQFSNVFVINNSANEKLVMSHSIDQNTAGAGTAPNRSEYAGKWVNTSNQITSIQAIASAGNFPTGSILKVWGAN